jgi:hypothetical protein
VPSTKTGRRRRGQRFNKRRASRPTRFNRLRSCRDARIPCPFRSVRRSRVATPDAKSKSWKNLPSSQRGESQGCLPREDLGSTRTGRGWTGDATGGHPSGEALGARGQGSAARDIAERRDGDSPRGPEEAEPLSPETCRQVGGLDQNSDVVRRTGGWSTTFQECRRALTNYCGVAQLAERRVHTSDVTSSSLVPATIYVTGDRDAARSERQAATTPAVFGRVNGLSL